MALLIRAESTYKAPLEAAMRPLQCAQFVLRVNVIAGQPVARVIAFIEAQLTEGERQLRDPRE
jgi:hypothetical protein